MEYVATVWDPYQQYNSVILENVQHRVARFMKNRYGRHSNVSEMLDEFVRPPLSQMTHEASSTKLPTVWHKCNIPLMMPCGILYPNPTIPLPMIFFI